MTYTVEGETSALTARLTARMDLSKKNDPASSPMRATYVKTMGHLFSPEQLPIRPEQAERAADFMNRTLDKDYVKVVTHTGRREQKQLSALRPDGAWHHQSAMYYGEHTVARLAHNLTRLHDGLVLIDQVETGLHSVTRRALVKKITRISRENEIQFILTTHCPEVMSAVPAPDRIFLQTDRAGSTSVVRDISPNQRSLHT